MRYHPSVITVLIISIGNLLQLYYSNILLTVFVTMVQLTLMVVAVLWAIQRSRSPLLSSEMKSNSYYLEGRVVNMQSKGLPEDSPRDWVPVRKEIWFKYRDQQGRERLNRYKTEYFGSMLYINDINVNLFFDQPTFLYTTLGEVDKDLIKYLDLEPIGCEYRYFGHKLVDSPYTLIGYFDQTSKYFIPDADKIVFAGSYVSYQTLTKQLLYQLLQQFAWLFIIWMINVALFVKINLRIMPN